MKKATKSIEERIAKRNSISEGWAADSFEKDSNGDYFLFGTAVSRGYVEEAADGDYRIDFDSRFIVGYGPDDDGTQQACWAVKLNPLG